MKLLKSLLIFTVCCFVHYNIISQNSEEKISDTEWDNLINLLIKENWSGAEKLSAQYLKKFSAKDDSPAQPAIVRYMYLTSVAAQLGEKQYCKEKALKKTRDLVGKTIITPTKEFLPNGIFNCFSLSSDSTCFFSCSSNEDMTVIQMFEKYEMADSNTLTKALNSEYDNKKLRIGAVIKEINAGGYTMPRLELVFKDAFIWDEE
jgi:hypothetical protein